MGPRLRGVRQPIPVLASISFSVEILEIGPSARLTQKHFSSEDQPLLLFEFVFVFYLPQRLMGAFLWVPCAQSLMWGLSLLGPSSSFCLQRAPSWGSCRVSARRLVSARCAVARAAPVPGGARCLSLDSGRFQGCSVSRPHPDVNGGPCPSTLRPEGPAGLREVGQCRVAGCPLPWRTCKSPGVFLCPVLCLLNWGSPMENCCWLWYPEICMHS